jgi:hypothetical protein
MRVVSNTQLPIPPGDSYIDNLPISVVYSPDGRPVVFLPSQSGSKQMYYFNRFNARYLKLGGFRSDLPLTGEQKTPVVGTPYGVTMVDNSWTGLRLSSFPWNGLKSVSRMSSTDVKFPQGTYAQGASAVFVPGTHDGQHKILWIGIQYRQPSNQRHSSQTGLLVAEIPCSVQNGRLVVEAEGVAWQTIALPDDAVGNSPYGTVRLYTTSESNVDVTILYQGAQPGRSALQFLRRRGPEVWGALDQFQGEIMTGIAYGDVNIVDAVSSPAGSVADSRHPNRLFLASGRSGSTTKYSTIWYGIDGTPIGSDDVVTFAAASVQAYRIFGHGPLRTSDDYIFAGATWTGCAVVA